MFDPDNPQFLRERVASVEYLGARMAPQNGRGHRVAGPAVSAHRVVLVRCSRCRRVMAETRGTTSQIVRTDVRQPSTLRNAHEPTVFGGLSSGAPHEFGCACGASYTVNFSRLEAAFQRAASHPTRRDRAIVLPLPRGYFS